MEGIKQKKVDNVRAEWGGGCLSPSVTIPNKHRPYATTPNLKYALTKKRHLIAQGNEAGTANCRKTPRDILQDIWNFSRF